MNDEIKTFGLGFDSIKNLLEKLAGPALEEIGFMLQDQIKLYRFKNLLKILTKTKSVLEEKNIDPKTIPFKTLIPLLEGASLEENEFLSTKWANLISNAATGSLNKDSHPSYSKILMELSPLDALLLDEIFTTKEIIIWNTFMLEFSEKHSLSFDEVLFGSENLFRLNLINKIDNYLHTTPYGEFFFKACNNK